MSEPPALELIGIGRVFHQAGQTLAVLQGASLTVGAGELVALTGPSGAGKSTLLHIAGLLERPDQGEVRICGRATNAMSEGQRTAERSASLGFVYQFHRLLPDFSALENVMLPQMIAGSGRSAARARASELLAMVGLSQRASHRPGRLSGGEQQRVAIARALANRPRLLLADEPTGNLDPHTAREVFQHLKRLGKQVGLGALVATHNMELANEADRIVRLVEGGIVADRG
ncbi:MAG: ABC transporter ATP-binding protein [Alphaproteobacteria bacterium]|nr:ABC transporter ATP-binding protein [Alphaproteobacteria bacterium]